MELTIKIQIGCEEALTKALTALAMGVTRAPQGSEDATAVAAAGAAGKIAAPSTGETDARAPRAESKAEGASNAAPAAPTPAPADAAAEVRKVMSATRARLGAKAGSATYASLNSEFVRIARQLGEEKPTALTAGKVGEFKEICDTIMLDADGESLAAPF